MKKDKILKLGVYASGLVTGSVIGVFSSTLLFPGLAPVILGSVGATIFSKLFVSKYEKRNSVKEEPIKIVEQKNEDENFDFFKTNKKDMKNIQEMEINQTSKKKIRI